MRLVARAGRPSLRVWLPFLEVGRNYVEDVRLERVVVPAPLLPVVHQSRLPQDLQVEGQSRLRRAERVLQLAHALLAAREQVDDPESCLIREGVEEAGGPGRSACDGLHASMIDQQILVGQGGCSPSFSGNDVRVAEGPSGSGCGSFA